MIEINLLEKKKSFKAPVILGVDFAKLPWRGIIVSVLLATYPLDFYVEHTQEVESQKQEEVRQLRTRYIKIRKELKKNQGIKDQLTAFNTQIEKLKQRSAQVDKIIQIKTNPRLLLELLAKITPDDLWFDELIVDDRNKLMLKGGADSYQSIGEFILQANESPFFGKTLQLKDSKTKEQEVKGVNYREENFEIEGEIIIFDPFITGR